MAKFHHHEQRQFGRRPVSIAGEVILPLRPPIPCHIHDLSAKGALIEVPDSGQLPSRFKLEAPLAEIKTNCNLVRRVDDRCVGVSFDVFADVDKAIRLTSAIGVPCHGPRRENNVAPQVKEEERVKPVILNKKPIDLRKELAKRTAGRSSILRTR